MVFLNNGVETMEYLTYHGEYGHRKKEFRAVILLDINMPRMDGLKVVDSIRYEPALKDQSGDQTSSREEPDHGLCYHFGVNA